jgi:HSP20 family molecular chaperone IbpA
MSLLQRGFYAPEASFAPLIRLLDDFDSYSRGGNNGPRRRRARAFGPRFDVRETDTAFELYGELPGIERDNINIEFTDPQTVVVSGRVERTRAAGTLPADLAREGAEASEAVPEAGEQHDHKATVSDEADEEAKEKGVLTPAETPVTTKVEPARAEPGDKFWVSERSVGQFSRSFSFPSRIEQDGVKAGLSNGILALTVPKAKKHESRRIAIS